MRRKLLSLSQKTVLPGTEFIAPWLGKMTMVNSLLNMRRIIIPSLRMTESITTQLAISIPIKKQLNNRTFKKGEVKPVFLILKLTIK